jgi:hypothetical protein
VGDDVDEAAEGRDGADRGQQRPADRPAVLGDQDGEEDGAGEDRHERRRAREALPLPGERGVAAREVGAAVGGLIGHRFRRVPGGGGKTSRFAAQNLQVR